MNRFTFTKFLALLLGIITMNVLTSTAQISDLAVDGGIFSSAFDAEVTTYSVEVPTGTTEVDVMAIPANAATSISGEGTVALSGGSGTSTIDVMEADGSSITYTINISEADITLGYSVTETASATLSSGCEYTMVDYTSTYWGGDTGATLSQYPAVDVTFAYEGTFYVVLKSELNGSIETKFLPLNLSLDSSQGSIWTPLNGSTDFYVEDNWVGKQSWISGSVFSEWNYFYIRGEQPVCKWTDGPSKYYKYYVLNGGELHITNGTVKSDRAYIKEDGHVTISGESEWEVRKSFEIAGGTLTILDNVDIWASQYASESFTLKPGLHSPAVINIFGGNLSATAKKALSIDTTSQIVLKNGGVISFADSASIAQNVENGVIRPGANSLLAYADGATSISSITLDIPEMRYEIYDADSNFVVPDYTQTYAVGATADNIEFTQTPAAGTVIDGKEDLIAGVETSTSVTIEAIDYFGNSISVDLALSITNNSSIWRGGFSENFSDSANWVGNWPLKQWETIIIDKTSASDFDPVYTGYSFKQFGGLIIMANNKITLTDGGELLPYSPTVMNEGSEIVVDGGVLNMRWNKGTYTFDNGTVSVLSHKDGYSWAEFDKNSSIIYASNLGDEFTFNCWGGESSFKNMSIGDGTLTINFKDGGAATFNDSALVADILSNGVIETAENTILVVEAGNVKVTGSTAIAPENQRGLVDGEGNFEVPDYTPLVTFSQVSDNEITIEQSPAAGTIISEIGEQEIVFTASDQWGNISVASCILDVIDYNIYCPGDTTITDDNPADSVLIPDFTLVSEAAGIWKGEVTKTQFPLAGTKVALDSIFEVTVTAVDTAENSSYCSFMVTVIDTTMPVITPRGDELIAMDEYCIANIPDYSELVTVTDICYKEFTFIQTPAAGTQLSNVGDTAVVSLSVEDGNGNTSEAISFTVTAADLTDPTITKAFGDHSVSSRNGCEYPLPDYSAMVSATDYCTSELLITQTPVGGTMLSGDGDSIVVTVSFDDQNGNVVDSSWTVTLVATNCGLSQDANLATLTTSVGDLSPEFNAETLDYTVELPFGTTEVPAISATTADDAATADVVEATELNGTTTITVTAENTNFSKVYTVNFKLNTGISTSTVSNLIVYPSPATTSVTIDASELGDDVTVTIIDLAGNVKAILSDKTSRVSISDFTSGVYVVKAVSSTGFAITKFVKE